MRIGFYVDPETEAPHIQNHAVDEVEVADVLANPGEDRAGTGRIACGDRSHEGWQALRVIYVPDPEPASVFVITAYELAGKALLTYRRRRKRKGKR